MIDVEIAGSLTDAVAHGLRGLPAHVGRTFSAERDAVPQGIFALDTNAMPWGDMHVEDIDAHLPVKGLISDPDTGMSVTKIVYKAGFTNITHWHNCSHGIYVLDGIFRTEGIDYGPGCFVWFPEGVAHSHGAGEATDATFLFITNKAFDINYLHLGKEPPVKA